MTNISKRKLPQKEFDRLYKKLSGIAASLNERDLLALFDNLFGEEERIMLTKRFAAVSMYIEGNSPYRVSQLLKISPSTAESIHKDFESGRYKEIQNLLRTKKMRYEDFWRTLEVILQAGMPPRGRGRWKSVLKNMSK